MAKLILRIKGKEKDFAVPEGGAVIGRSPECHVQVDEEGISKKHCEITKKEGRFFLRDLGSLNGTKVNGVKGESFFLKDGDILSIGKLNLFFEEGIPQEEETEVPLVETLEPSGKKDSAQKEPPPAPAVPEVSIPAEEALPWEEKRVGAKKEEGRPERWVPYLRYAREGGEWEKFFLKASRTTMGRKNKNDLHLPDPSVSGFHAEIVRQGPDFVLRDLGSTNGTFLSGARVKEDVILRGGDEIRLGKAKLYFIEKEGESLQGVPGIQVEEELEQAEIALVDEEVLRRRGKDILAVFALVLILLAGAGIVYTIHAVQRGREKPQPDRDNLFQKDWSFEEETSGDVWVKGEDSPVSPQIERGAAHSGLFCLALKPPGGEEWSSATFSPLLAVLTSKKYNASFWVRGGSKGGLSGMKVRWISRRRHEDFSKTSFSCLIRGGSGNFKKVEAFFSPPRDATHAEVSLVAWGEGGPFYFDDVAFHQTAESSSKSTLVVNHFEFEFGSRGSLSVKKGGTYLLKELQALVEIQQKRLPQNPFLDLDSEQSSFTESKGVFKGMLGEKNFKQECALTGRGLSFVFAREGSASEGELKLAVRPRTEFLSEGLLLVYGGTAQRISKPLRAPGVSSITMGKEMERLHFIFPHPVIFDFREEGIEKTILLSPSEEEKNQGRISFEIQTDFKEEKERAFHLKREAERCEQAKQLGRALALCEEILRSFPFEENLVLEVEERRARLRRIGSAELEGLRKEFEEGKLFYNPAQCRRVMSEMESFLSSFRGSSLAAEAGVLYGEISSHVSELDKARSASEGEIYFRRGKDLLDLGYRDLAESFFTYVVKNYPETRWCTEAQEELKSIQEKR